MDSFETLETLTCLTLSGLGWWPTPDEDTNGHKFPYYVSFKAPDSYLILTANLRGPHTVLQLLTNIQYWIFLFNK